MDEQNQFLTPKRKQSIFRWIPSLETWTFRPEGEAGNGDLRESEKFSVWNRRAAENLQRNAELHQRCVNRDLNGFNFGFTSEVQYTLKICFLEQGFRVYIFVNLAQNNEWSCLEAFLPNLTNLPCLRSLAKLCTELEISVLAIGLKLLSALIICVWLVAIDFSPTVLRKWLSEFVAKILECDSIICGSFRRNAEFYSRWSTTHCECTEAWKSSRATKNFREDEAKQRHDDLPIVSGWRPVGRQVSCHRNDLLLGASGDCSNVEKYADDRPKLVTSLLQQVSRLNACRFPKSILSVWILCTTFLQQKLKVIKLRGEFCFFNEALIA